MSQIVSKNSQIEVRVKRRIKTYCTSANLLRKNEKLRDD